MKKILLFLPLLVALNLSAGEFFAGGKTAWRISIDPNASSTVKYAATELSAALKKISGAEFATTETSAPSGSANIIVGDLSYRPVAAARDRLKLKDGAVENVAVYTLDGNLYLAGNTPRGALYAVYSFLQNQLGVRWLTPGDDGEIMPPRQSYDLPQLAYNHTPSFQYRGLHLCYRHVDPVYETWMTRNFLNIMRSSPGKPELMAERSKKGMHIMFSDHNVTLPKELLTTDPECFAELNGVRHERQICLTNPKAEKLIVEKILNWVSNNPELEILSIFPADNMDYCNCAGCIKEDRSTTWFNFYKRVCEQIATKFPKLKFSTIAYQSYLEVPKTDLSFSEFIEYCQHDRCYMHKLKSDCPLNQKSLARIAKWKEHGTPLGIYGYEFDIFATVNSVYIPFPSVITEGIREFRQLGIKSVITEVWQDFPPKNEARKLSRQNAVNIYLYARLLWDADADANTLITDWNRGVYDGAAAEAERVQQILAQRWDNTDSHISNYHNAPFGTAEKLLNPEIIAELDKLFKDGMAKLSSGSKERANFEFFQTTILQWQQAYWSSVQAGNIVNVPRAADTANPFANAIRLPDFKGRDNGKFPPTEVYLSWDNQYLNVRAVCHDPDIAKLRAAAVKRDENVWLDDSIELFISNPANRHGIYKHISVNPKGVLYDAAAYGPGGADLTWNPEIKVSSQIGTDRWTVELRIPFAANEPVPAAGESWRFSVKRSIGNGRGDFANSGYPDASYHDPNSFATLYFNAKTKTDKHLLALVPNAKIVTAARSLQDAMLRDGWNGEFICDPARLPKDFSKYDILMVRLPQFGMPKEMNFQKICKEFLDAGKVVIFSTYEYFPLEIYLADPSLAVEGSSWKTDPLRKTVEIAPGDWSTKPDNLRPLLENALCPPWGYRAKNPEHWKTLASLKTKDGNVFPYLLVRPYGKGGLLVVTGSDLGLAGGGVLFGNGKPDTVCMLFNNLLAYK